MNRQDFLRLVEAVEDQGGAHLDEVCSMSTYSEWTGDREVKPLHVAGCAKRTLFEVPYDALDKEGNEQEYPHSVKLCAVEDMMHLMPRFQEDSA
jgi:hypothetical protein